MKTIKYEGEEAVLTSEIKRHGYILLTFVQRSEIGFRIIKMTYDETFGDLCKEVTYLPDHVMEAVELFRNYRIDAKEFVERMQLAQ